MYISDGFNRLFCQVFNKFLELAIAKSMPKNISSYFMGLVKGQLISKCPFGVLVWTKIPTKLFPGFLD